jgi:heptosyltransferase II
MRILVVQTSFFGDLILSTPVIKALAEIHPAAEISVMTTKAARPLIERDPLIKRVISFDKRGEHRGFKGFWLMVNELRSYQFDCVYSLHRSYRTSLLLAFARIPLRIGFRKARLSFLYHRLKDRHASQHDVLRNLSLLDGEGSYDREHISLRLTAPEASQVSDRIRRFSEFERRPVVIFPGSEWQTKMWHWQGYRQVAAYLISRGYPLLILGGSREKAVATLVSQGLQAENLAGTTTLDEVLYLVKNAALVICNDSMALHVAAALQVPVIPIFCSTSPTFGFGPWRVASRVLERDDLACKPCRRHGSRVCPLGTEECMRGLSSAVVIKAAVDLLGNISVNQ